MCKYCEEVKYQSDSSGYIAYIRNGGACIIYDPEDVGFLLQVPDNYTYSIDYCPWCGRKLELPEKEEKKAVVLTQEGYDDLANKYDKLQKDLANLWRCLLDHYKYEDDHTYKGVEFTNFVRALEKLM